MSTENEHSDSRPISSQQDNGDTQYFSDEELDMSDEDLTEAFKILREAIPKLSSMTDENLTQYAILSAARDYISQIKSEDEAERKKMEELERQNKKLQKKLTNVERFKAEVVSKVQKKMAAKSCDRDTHCDKEDVLSTSVSNQ